MKFSTCTAVAAIVTAIVSFGPAVARAQYGDGRYFTAPASGYGYYPVAGYGYVMQDPAYTAAGPAAQGGASCGCGQTCGGSQTAASCGSCGHACGAGGGQEACGGQDTCGARTFCSTPRWTATADALYLDRIGHRNQTLLTDSSQADVLNVQDLRFHFEAGPRVSLIRHGDCCDLEAGYFGIDGWHASGIRSDPQGVNFHAPGFTVRAAGESALEFSYGSKLYSWDVNLRRCAFGCLTLLAGFRWVELHENLTGDTLVNGVPVDTFWTTNSDNHLYGLQLGADATLWDCGGPFRLNGFCKAGAFANYARQTSTAANPVDPTVVAHQDAWAFLGEAGLVGVYQFTDCIALRAGYQVMFINGVALAPDQIPVTNVASGIAAVDTSGHLFYHGALAGLEIVF